MRMERDIRVPIVKNLDHWPLSYDGMYNDLTRSIILAKANYLVALGLFCYTEIVGRDLLRFRKHTMDGRYDNKECFDTFLREYMGYGQLLDAYPHLYDIFRNGLCHGYFIKREHSDGGSGVFLYYSDEEEIRNDIAAAGGDLTKGIVIAADGKKKVFIIEPYLNDFINGLHKLVEEMWAVQWNPDLR
jgi:hypothetical protein